MNEYDDLYFAYKIYIPSSFDWGRSVKCPGLGIPEYFSAAGQYPTGLNDSRWTGTILWHINGTLAMYMYHSDQNNDDGDGQDWGDHLWWDDFGGQAVLEKGKWNQLEVRYKLNTPGVLDGLVEAWLNGEKRLSSSSVMYKGSGYDTTPANDNLSIGSINMISRPTTGPTQDEVVVWDDFIVSESPITH